MEGSSNIPFDKLLLWTASSPLIGTLKNFVISKNVENDHARGKARVLGRNPFINNLGITVNSAFTPSANVLTVANKARGMLNLIERSFTCLTKEIFLPLYRALVRPHLEYAIQANCPYLKKDIYHLERIQRAATRCERS